MPTKTASTLSVILTVILLAVFAPLGLFFEMIALNGATERQGMTALGISILCQGTGLILLGWLAWKSTSLLVTKHNLNPILAVILTVALSALAGGVLAFLSLLISIPLAGIR